MLDLEPMKKALEWHEKAKLPYEGTIMARSLIEEIERLRESLKNLLDDVTDYEAIHAAREALKCST